MHYSEQAARDDYEKLAVTGKVTLGGRGPLCDPRPIINQKLYTEKTNGKESESLCR
ncbi:hypothetical protein CCP3SC15_380032 [Gammaproteobacteria bacterium]